MTAMLLSDHGADVVRVEPPGGDGFGHWPGYVVWNRGKRRVVLDLTTPAGRDELLAMVAEADVLLETYRPGVTARLGIDYGVVGAINDRLVYATITGYGSDTPDAARPGIEWLVTARAGLQWDQGGWYGTRADHILGTDLTEPGFDVPEGAVQTGCREGPIFLAMPWASIGATLLAVTGISSGLYVRERTGRGQHFETSLVQAAIMANAMGWQRPGRMHPSYRLWYFDRRAPKGIFRTGDGRWLHQFAPIDHEFIRANAADADPAAAGAVVRRAPAGRQLRRLRGQRPVPGARPPRDPAGDVDPWARRVDRDLLGGAGGPRSRSCRPRRACSTSRSSAKGSSSSSTTRSTVRSARSATPTRSTGSPTRRSAPAALEPVTTDDVLASWPRRPR